MSDTLADGSFTLGYEGNVSTTYSMIQPSPLDPTVLNLICCSNAQPLTSSPGKVVTVLEIVDAQKELWPYSRLGE